MRIFQDMAVRVLRHHLGHYMVLGCLMGEASKDIKDYLRKARQFPLWPLHWDLALAPDMLFSELKNQIPKPHLRE